MTGKVIAGFLLGIGSIVTIALLAVLSGTIVWLIWPVAIPAAFPGAVASGAIAGALSWKASVFLTWIFGILIKATQTNTNN